MTQSPHVAAAAQDDKDRVIQTITLGFLADPVARWIWPDAATYLETMPKFAKAFGGAAFDHDTAYIADACKAAALWLPPGVAPDGDAIEKLLADSVKPETQEDAALFFAQMDEYHPDDQPVWYLPMIAADPAFMGRGLGAAIMKYALRRCDEDGVIAYLESSNPRNISLYERCGFEVIGKIQAGSSPPMYPMIREARK
ncbi:MAG: GNAT family N-acetyltransferase [Pseudomonadota bacterium]